MRDKTERLLNLLIALSSAGRPVARHELRTWLLDQYGARQTDEAFEKMFERDKDELRSMGIPIETVTNAHNEVVGYRVRTSEVQMPAVSFTPQEMAVLSTAASLWDSAATRSPARQALRKLEAIAPEFDEQPGIRGVLTGAGESFTALVEAAAQRIPVSFKYRRNEVETRHVQPWGVISKRGHWYLVGYDSDRADARVFRLSRICSAVKFTGTARSYDVPSVDPVDLVQLDLDEPHIATLAVTPDRCAALRRRAHNPEGDVLSVTYSDHDLFAAELASYGSDVVVQSPPELRAALIGHLKRLAS